MKLLFRMGLGDEQDPDPIVLKEVGSDWTATDVCLAVGTKLRERYEISHQREVQIQLDGRPILGVRSIG